MRGAERARIGFAPTLTLPDLDSGAELAVLLVDAYIRCGRL
jgi:hypothetical protein